MLGINLVRLTILRELQAHDDGLTTGELAKRLDIPRQTVVRHIRSLEEEDLVHSNTSNRRGDRVQYKADRTQLAIALDDLRTYVLPAD